MKLRPQERQSGNILFLILIAVALFAALSYAVSQSGGFVGDAGHASEQKMEAAFGEIKNVVVAHRQAVQRMIMSGIPPQNISAFQSGGWGPHAYNWDNIYCTNASPDHSCKLYHPLGGGLSYYNFTQRYPELTVMPYNQHSNMVSAGWWGDSNGTRQSGGTSEYDFLYSVKITKEFCDFINEKLDVDYTGASDGWTTPSALGFLYQLGGGGLGPSSAGIGGTHHARHLFGKDMGCWRSTHSGGDTYWFTALIYLR